MLLLSAHLCVQLLGSAYLLGATSDHLNEIYDTESKILDPWKDSPGEISQHDWREYLGDTRNVSQSVFPNTRG